VNFTLPLYNFLHHMLGPVSAVQVSCSTLFSKTLNHIYTDSHYIFYMYE